MNKYRAGLTAMVILFAIIAIFSSIIGVGFFKGLLIFTALILLIIIFAGGIAALGAKVFWREYFKEFAAVPVAWGLLHVGFVLVLPDVSKEIWTLHWQYLMAIELCALTLCVFLSKGVPFAKRISRSLLMLIYVLLFIASGYMIGYRLFWGKAAADQDREKYSRLMISRTELMVRDIERNKQNHKAEPLFKELRRLTENSKRELTKDEEQRVQTLKTSIQKIYEAPIKKSSASRPLIYKHRRPRRLTAIFELPANGKTINQDRKGQKLSYRKGEQIQLEQLTSPPRKLTFVNRNIPSWTRRQKICTSGPATKDGWVELRASGGEKITVQVRIIPCRRI